VTDRLFLQLAAVVVCGGAGLSAQSPVSLADAIEPPRAAYVQYLADGTTGPVYATRIAIANPQPRTATVHLSFNTADGRQLKHTLKVGPTSRATVSPANIAGLESAEFSTIVESDESVLVDSSIASVERNAAARSSRAVTAPSTTWFMAGGATHSGMDLSYVLVNPNATSAVVTVHYLLPHNHSSLSKSYRIAPFGRVTIRVSEEARTDVRLRELNDVDVSAAITSSVPIVAEKTTSLGQPGQSSGAGFGGPGVASASTRWFFAEGMTGPSVDMFLTLANPNPTAAVVDARYLLPSGEVIARSYSVPANDRSQVWVDLEDARLADTQVAVMLVSANRIPVVVERSLFWPGPSPLPRTDAVESAGVTETSSRWGIAEGEVGGTSRMATRILLANTSPTAGSVSLTLLFEDGTTAVKRFRVRATSRFTIDVAQEFPAVRDRRFGAIVESLAPQALDLAVEWSMSTAGAGSAQGRSGALAAPIPQPERLTSIVAPTPRRPARARRRCRHSRATAARRRAPPLTT
jgi:hypothetical protein